jgi:arylsulfatase A-like enzyme
LGFVVILSVLLTLAAPVLVSNDKAAGVPAMSIVGTSPMARALDFHRLTPAEVIRESRELRIKDYLQARTVETSRSGGQPPLNVLLVILESTFNKHLSLFGAPYETQPLLRRYQGRMELFPNYYAPFPNSLHARFSILNGLYATEEYVSYVNPRIPAPSLFEILDRHGYVNSLFYSSHRDYTRFADYVAHRRLDVLYDCNNMPGRERFRTVAWGIEEACTKAAIETQLAKHAADGKPFFLTYVPAAPHQPFDVPDRRFAVFDTSQAFLKNDFTGPYLNSLRYMDWVVAGLVDKLEELRLLDRTLVIITGDHGEMLGEQNGPIGHGWNADPTLSNVPLIIMDPRRPGYRINLALGSHVDLLPTALDLLGVPLPAGELYQGVTLFDEEATRKRRVYLNSYHERAMIEGDRFIWNDPKQRRGISRTFEINHNGACTSFIPIEAANRGGRELDRFERMQRSLIRYYGVVRDSLPAARSAGSAAGP